MPSRNSSQRTLVISLVLRRLNLRFPGLFLFVAILTLADLLISGLNPFIDGIGLALLALLVAIWKNRRTPLTPDSHGKAWPPNRCMGGLAEPSEDLSIGSCEPPMLPDVIVW